MRKPETIAAISDNITPTLVGFFCQKLVPGHDRVLAEDMMTPLIDELAKAIFLMMTSAIVRDRRQIVLDFGDLMKCPVVVSSPEYYKHG